MRYNAKTDANHAPIRDGLRELGMLVADVARMGKGFPDLLVGYRGRLILLEVKDGDKPPSARRLTNDEADFHAAWADYPVLVVLSLQDAIRQIEEAT